MGDRMSKDWNKEFKAWLESYEYNFNERNPCYKSKEEIEKELEKLPKELNSFFGDDESLIRQKHKLIQQLVNPEPEYQNFSYKLTDKYAIEENDQRFERHYICGGDLREAFLAGVAAGLAKE